MPESAPGPGRLGSEASRHASAPDRVSLAGEAAARERHSGQDTLLSAPTPSEASQLDQERLADAERRLDDAETRLRALERFAASTRQSAEAASLRWLGWVVVLAALAAVWLIWHSHTR